MTLNLAIFELGECENLNVAAVTRQFNVFIERLINQWRGYKSKIEYEVHNKDLSKISKLVLCQYLDNLDEKELKTYYKQLK